MGLFSTFFKPPKHRVFDFKPRYYDEIKDRQEKRFAQLEREKILEEKYGKQYLEHDLKGAFRARREEVARVKHRSNVRFVIILAGLVLMAYYLLYK